MESFLTGYPRFLRPRPTYKSHLKRASISSVGEGEKRPRKPRKSASGGRSHSRKNSDESNPNGSSENTSEAPEDVKPDIHIAQAAIVPMEIDPPMSKPIMMSTMIAPEVVEKLPMQVSV